MNSGITHRQAVALLAAMYRLTSDNAIDPKNSVELASKALESVVSEMQPKGCPHGGFQPPIFPWSIYG